MLSEAMRDDGAVFEFKRKQSKVPLRLVASKRVDDSSTDRVIKESTQCVDTLIDVSCGGSEQLQKRFVSTFVESSVWSSFIKETLSAGT